jgi:hypothetical protein
VLRAPRARLVFSNAGVGVATTIIGFAIRYVAHLKQKREIEETKREARRR